MLFSEVYSVYYSAVAQVLREAVDGVLTGRRVTEIVRDRAFGESVLTIPAALRDGAWPLIDGEGRTPIRHEPTMPLTTLERRWMKALLLDPRIALFSPSIKGLEDVEPLYRPEDIVLFDQYTDGDPYGAPDYVQRFRTVLRAFHERRRLHIRYTGRRGGEVSLRCVPYRLEYSVKDDKFRLITAGTPKHTTVNLARVLSCELLDGYDEVCEPEEPPEHITFLLRDRRNALERVMLHFSHFEKTSARLGDDLYEVDLSYDREDEAELLIRVLSFGPMIRVTKPDAFIVKLRDRIERQIKLMHLDESDGR